MLFDGQPIGYTITSSDQIWILEFTYTHSIHNVEVNFDMYSTFTSSPEPTPTPTPALTPDSTLPAISTPTQTPEPEQLQLPSTFEIAGILMVLVFGVGLLVNLTKKRSNK